MSNSIRYDLSSYLIHFFRKLDLTAQDAPDVPEDWGPGAIVEDDTVSPLFLLRNSIRLGKVWATWSVRGGKRTVYGPKPAVCFTDMPIGAFIEAGEARAALGQAMSPIGIIIPKIAAYAQGARPAIYGLSSNPIIPTGSGGGERLIPVEALPLDEQYRYVTFVPNKGIDWTHEREWRWACPDPLPDVEELPPANGSEIPGLELGRFLGMGVVVRTQAQEDKVLHDILTATDRSQHGFSPYDFIINREKIPDLTVLRDPASTDEIIEAGAVPLAPYYKIGKAARGAQLANLESAVQRVLEEGPRESNPISGKTWLWLLDNGAPLTRALVYEKRMTINGQGRYLLEIPQFHGYSGGDREALIKQLAQLLDTPATYHTVMGSADPDGIPSYCDPSFEDTFHFNYAHDEDDC